MMNQVRSQDMTAVGIAKTLHSILSQLCSPASCPPRSCQTCLSFPEALKQICAKVELVDADAAADEQLAGELTKGFFVNLRCVNKDLSHALRRVDRRSTMADPFLRDVMIKFTYAKRSPAQLLQNSEVFKERFSAHVRNTSGMRCKDLRSAKHRHESIQKPRGRTDTHLHSFHIS
jgi:hypothetical protein